MPQAELGSFLALIPPPLGLGSVELEDGSWVKGFICEPAALAGAEDISAFGGWRAYRKAAA
jgi:allophanate hydrolase